MQKQRLVYRVHLTHETLECPYSQPHLLSSFRDLYLGFQIATKESGDVSSYVLGQADVLVSETHMLDPALSVR